MYYGILHSEVSVRISRFKDAVLTCMKSASRKGGLASTPHAEVLLLALKQSKLCRALEG